MKFDIRKESKFNHIVGQKFPCGWKPDFPNNPVFAFVRLWCISTNLHSCMSIRQVSMSMFSSLLATRVGEAANPGPFGKKRENQLTVAISNPTAILTKKKDLLHLDSQIVFLSETSATSVVQTEFSHNLLGTGFRIFFGMAVTPKRMMIDGRESYRGEAIGTAIMTSLPSRKPFEKIPDELFNTCRINASVIRMGHLDVLSVAIYGYPNYGNESKRYNDFLLARVYQVVTSAGLPFLIGGDFNIHPQSLPSYQAFKSIGSVEAFEYFQWTNGYMLPATCRGATRNDTCIMHPVVARYIKHMDVKSEFQINIHTPLRIHFSFNEDIEPMMKWEIPQSWHQFEPSRELLAQSYQKISAKHDIDTVVRDHDKTSDEILQKWSHAVEVAVDRTLQIQHMMDPVKFPTKGLPKSCFGRCKEQKLKQMKPQNIIKKDVTNKYDPPEEVFRIRTRQKVRQVRRIRSLITAINQANLKSSFGPYDLRTAAQLQNEWNAILRAKGYTGEWQSWILGFDCISWVPLTLPTLELLHDVAQITEHDSNLVCQQEGALRRYHFKKKIETSLEEGHGKMVYRIIKNDPIKTLHEVPYTVKADANLIRRAKGHQCLQIHQQIKFQCHAVACFEDAKIFITSQSDRLIYFQVHEGVIPAKGTLVQNLCAVTHTEISKQFHQYWEPFWQRDQYEEQWNDDTWTSFLQEIEHVPFPDLQLQISLDDPDIWVQKIRSLKNNKAFGVCGWRNEEFKLLPYQAIEHLVQAFKIVFAKGFSANLMQARTVLLAKNSNPQGMHHTRPITILGSLVRLVSKVIADQVLEKMQNQIPMQISGGIPARGAKDLTLQQQYVIESSINTRTGIGGYTLDLVKAFNLIPRWPLKKLFVKLNVPRVATEFWFKNLGLLVRLPQIGSCLGKSMTSTCGIPEGDAMSVLGMVILSITFWYKISCPQIDPFTYADNWSWIAKNTRMHIRSLISILNWVESLKMKIDQTKSWAWGTDKNFKECAKNLSLLFPSGDVVIQVQNFAKDLGMTIHYDKQQVLGCIQDRIKTGLARASRLEWIPMSIDAKAWMIQSAIWPVALYSAESQAIGLKHFRDLRRAATKALTGNHKTSSSFLACSTLCPNVMDPLLYVVISALRTIRRLATYNREMAQQFVCSVAAFEGDYSVGPASALKIYLHRIGWELQTNGNLEGPERLCFNIFDVSTKELNREMKLGWQKYVCDNIANRKGAPKSINMQICQKVYQSLSQGDKPAIALNIVGGFQTGATKHIWNNEESETCELCGQVDDRAHRLLGCPVMVDVRNKHPEAIHILTEVRPDWVYVPVAYMHPSVSLFRCILHARRMPEPVALHQTTQNRTK